MKIEARKTTNAILKYGLSVMIKYANKGAIQDEMIADETRSDLGTLNIARLIRLALRIEVFPSEEMLPSQ